MADANLQSPPLAPLGMMHVGAIIHYARVSANGLYLIDNGTGRNELWPLHLLHLRKNALKIRSLRSELCLGSTHNLLWCKPELDQQIFERG